VKLRTKRIIGAAAAGAIAAVGYGAGFGLRPTKDPPPPPPPKVATWGDSNSGVVGIGIQDDGRWNLVENDWSGQCSLLGGSHVTSDAGGVPAPYSYKALGCPVGTDWHAQLQALVDRHTDLNYVVVNVGAIDALLRDGAPAAPGPEWQQAVRDVERIGSSHGAHVIFLNLGHFYMDPTYCTPYYASDFGPDAPVSWLDANVSALNSSTASASSTLDVRDVYGQIVVPRVDCLHYDQQDADAIANWIADNTH
jgi:lysophospholipase L1-like esterase